MTFISALLPIIMLIILGFILKRIRFLPEDTWLGIEKLTYFILFPALLINTLAKQSLTGIPWSSILSIVVITLLISALLMIFLRKILSESNATFTSIFQGGIRFNTYIMLAVAQSLYGASGLAMGTVTAGFMIVFINLWCISIFVIWGNSTFKGIGNFIKQIIANPLIIACAIGWLLSLSGLRLPLIAADFFKQLNIQHRFVQSRVGLVTPRIVCMIINEAYNTLQEGTATREDIDLGMKLGTAYPKGPFEWSLEIGLDHIYETLEALYQDTKDDRYKISPLLKTAYLKNFILYSAFFNTKLIVLSKLPTVKYVCINI